MSVKLGVIGGGQLAQMMATAAKKLEIQLIVQTPKESDPAAAEATEVILATIDDLEATAELATRCDVITFENEFIDLDALKSLQGRGICFRPSISSLSPLLDKYEQRRYLQSIELPVPRFAAASEKEITSPFRFPVVLKVRRHGYDGQGTFIIKDENELEATQKRLEGAEILLEEFIPYERELAVMAARNVTGEIVIYPVVETQQEDRVCRRVIVPADLTSEIARQVEAIARTLLVKLQVVGIFGIELFLTQGKVLVNEIAPRTHNSGHYTLDACNISQFEMHLRAVTGLPLTKPVLKSAGAVMVNLLGYEYSQDDYREKRARLAKIPQAHLHWYGKAESRPGRKLGHVTVLSAENRPNLLEIALALESIWYG